MENQPTKTYEEILGDQNALNALRRETVHADQHDFLDTQQQEIDDQKAAVLGYRVGQVVINRDGIVVDKQALDAETSAEHDQSGPYDANQR